MLINRRATTQPIFAPQISRAYVPSTKSTANPRRLAGVSAPRRPKKSLLARKAANKRMKKLKILFMLTDLAHQEKRSPRLAQVNLDKDFLKRS
jgi:hypothetical protein